MKKFLSTLIIIVTLLSYIPANALITTTSNINTLNLKTELFTVNSVLDAISNPSTKNSNLLNEITLPTSMGISFPKIDTSKIAPIHSPLLNTLPEKDIFFDELKKHGINDANMTLAEYYALETSWPMDEEEIEITKQLYPELESVDLTQWTIEKSQEYAKEQNIVALKKRFTPVQLAQLNRRGINIEDTFYLFKEYHSASSILSKSNAELKNTIEGYYRSAVAMTMGIDAYNQINAKYSETVTTLSTRAVPPSDKYTQTTYPLYGTDYFHNDTATSSKWIKIRVYRTLLAQSYIYDWDYSVNNSLYCTNLWGTYSNHSNGAHEGIDFYDPNTTVPNLYSPVYGVRVTENAAYHQVAIYDANITDTYTQQAGSTGKTYNFLHMTNLSSATYFSKYSYLGIQGNQGNGNGGNHLHFEVNLGRNAVLSTATNNHNLTSSSPYQLTEYLGEAPLPA